MIVSTRRPSSSDGLLSAPLIDVDHADDDRRPPRPLDRACARRRSRRRACRSTAARCAGVPLADRVGRDQPEGAAVRSRSKARRKKCATRSALPCDSSWMRLEPVEIAGRRVRRQSCSCRRTAGCRRSRRTRRLLALEHLRELDLPVERHERLRSAWRSLFEPASVNALSVAGCDSVGELCERFASRVLRLCRRRRTRRSRDRRIAAPGRARPAPRPTCRAAPNRDVSSSASRICAAQLG